MLAVPLGIAVVFVIARLSNPFGSVWGEVSANWVKEHLGWLIRGWQVVLPALVLYLVAYRIFACAYVKRARAIGVQVTLGEVWYCFMGFERGATIADLLSSNNDNARSR